MSIVPVFADVVFELAADRVKRVANRDMGILMRVVRTSMPLGAIGFDAVEQLVLAELYEGDLNLGASVLGGLRVTLRLPLAA